MPVDEVVFRHLGIAGQRIGDHAETDGGGPARRSNQDAGLPGLVGLHHAPFVDVHHRPVDGLVDDLLGDILPPAVAEMGRDQNLLLAIQIQYAFPGIDFQALDLDILRLTFLAVRSPCLDPLEDPGVLGRVGAESQPASVGDLEGGLLQNQAFLRILQIHPRMGRLLHLGREDFELPSLHDPLVVVARIGGIGGELETSLSGNGAMAGGVVATLLGQQRPDIPGEAEGTLILGSPNGDGTGGFPTRHPGREDQVAVRTRLDTAVSGEPDQPGTGAGKFGLRREVAVQAVRELSHHQELLRSIGSQQPDLGGHQADRRQLGRSSLGGSLNLGSLAIGRYETDRPQGQHGNQSGRRSAASRDLPAGFRFHARYFSPPVCWLASWLSFLAGLGSRIVNGIFFTVSLGPSRPPTMGRAVTVIQTGRWVGATSSRE